MKRVVWKLVSVLGIMKMNYEDELCTQNKRRIVIALVSPISAFDSP